MIGDASPALARQYDEFLVLNVVAPPALQPQAERIARFDRSRLAGLLGLVGLRNPGGPIDVVLADEHSELGRDTPDWIVGFAESRASRIVLFPARSPSYPHDSLEAVLQHEIAHVLISRAARGHDVPRWFHEGLALVAERSWGLEDSTRFVMAAARRRSIADLEDDFHRGEGSAARAYAVSGALVRYLLRSHGGDSPARILDRLGRGDRFDTAFFTATGAPLIDVEAAFWRDSRWSYVVPFVTSSAAIWLVIIGISVSAMRRRTRDRARLRQQWEEEERAVPDEDPPVLDFLPPPPRDAPDGERN